MQRPPVPNVEKTDEHDYLRLEDLPPAMHEAIFDTVGRASRRACKGWKDAHRPLKGLRMDAADLHDYLPSMLEADPGRFAHVSALVLEPPSGSRPTYMQSNPYANPHAPEATSAIFSALLGALPRLASLSDMPRIALADQHALPAHLPALAPQLTELAISTRRKATIGPLSNPSDPSAGVPLSGVPGDIAATLANLRPFTRLRTLSLKPALSASMHVELQGLSSLATLQALELLPADSPDAPQLPAAPWFAALRSLTQLTRLSVWPVLLGWDEPCARTLEGLTALRSLRLDVWPSPGAGGAVVSAVALLTALTELGTEVGSTQQEREALPELSSLQQLQRLTVAGSSEAALEAVLRAVSGLRALSHLAVRSLHGGGNNVDLGAACVPHLQALAACLQELELNVAVRSADAGAVFAGVARLPLLRVLRLKEMNSDGPWAGGAECLVGLSGLRVLEVRPEASMLSAGLLQGVARFTGLQVLALSGDQYLSEAQSASRAAMAAQVAAMVAAAVATGEFGEQASYENDDEDWPEPLTDAALLQLLHVRHTLVDLSLGTASDITGPGLAAVVPRLTGLTSLALHEMRPLADPRLLQYLQPLPRGLRRLRVSGQQVALAPGMREQLRAAADELADCTLAVEFPRGRAR